MVLASWRTRILAYIVLAVASGPAAAQGLPYEVRIDAPRPLEQMLEKNLDLLRWRGNPRLDREQLGRLVRSAPEQVRTLVATEGYYSPEVRTSLDESGGKLVAHVVVAPGQPVLVGDVELELRGFVAADSKQPFDTGALRNSWSLPKGRIFRQADWEEAKRTLLRRVVQTRYPRAQLAETSATVDPDVRRALLKVVIDSGPEMRLGGLRIEGLRRYPASIIRNLNPVKPGDEYSEAVLQSFQGRLQDTGYFSGVEVTADLSGVIAAGDAPAAGVVTLPVLVRVTENKYKNVSAGLGFSTNTGYRAQLNYDDLSVFGLRMKSALTLESRRQTAQAEWFFPTTAKGYNDSFGAAFERNDLRGEVTAVATLSAKRSWGTPLLERSLALEALTEQKKVAGQAPVRAQSLPLTYALTKRRLDNLLLPTKGYVLNAQVSAALLPVLTDEKFLRASARGILYRPLSSDSALILRAEAGTLVSRQKRGVPASFLFRAGGDQSVRGYGYQELGVREGEAIVGARHLASGSVEYQYYFKPPWGVAVFYDAGNAADKVKDLRPKSGYGVGARWRSPVGPINVDLAYGHAVRDYKLHFSLGFTF
jgi:translocation and assembly module TamA